MLYLFEVWKTKNIYFSKLTGQFVTESGYSSYVLSDARYAAINNI